MSVPRFLYKTVVSNVPVADQQSLTGTIPAAASVDSLTWNLQLAAFLNPVGIADPDPAFRVAPGHFLYLYCFYAGGTTVTMNVFARAYTGGVAFAVHSTAVAVSTATVVRWDDLGAAWEVFVRLSNGGATTVSFDLAVAFRSA